MALAYFGLNDLNWQVERTCCIWWIWRLIAKEVHPVYRLKYSEIAATSAAWMHPIWVTRNSSSGWSNGSKYRKSLIRTILAYFCICPCWQHITIQTIGNYFTKNDLPNDRRKHAASNKIITSTGIFARPKLLIDNILLKIKNQKIQV